MVRFNASGKMEKLEPYPEHPSGGIPCHKGLSFLDVHNDPDRLNAPLKRTNPRSETVGRYKEISWDSAFAEIGQRLAAIREEHGPDSVGIYFGNPIVFDSRGFFAVNRFMAESGSRMLFNANTQDAANKTAGIAEIYGSMSFMLPDLVNTQYLLCIGANPKISRWVNMAVPNDSLEIVKKIKRRGGKVCFINPRKIESSTPETGETVLITPGTDIYFLAALINEIFLQDGIDEALVGKHGKNLEGLKEFVERYPAARVARVTRISEEKLKSIANDIISAKSAAVYSATGLNQSRQGLLGFWLVEMVNFITGNLGKEGGTYSPTGYCDDKLPVPPERPQPLVTSIGEIPAPTDVAALPGVLLPSLIEGGDINALITFFGNPMFSIAGESKMRDAFSKLELMVNVDINLNSMSEMADYTLAAADWLERADINSVLANGHQSGTPYLQYTDAVVSPVGQRKEDWWIASKLSQAMGWGSVLDEPDSGQDGFAPLDQMLAVSGLSVEEIKTMPHQTALLEPRPKDELFERCLQHPDKKVDCCPPKFESAGLFDRCESIFQEFKSAPQGQLRLISLRTNAMHNTWLCNIHRFRKGTITENPLHMNPADAKTLGLFEGDSIRVYNDYGSIETLLRVSDEVGMGVVAMSHGYGQKGICGMSVAARIPGANCNELMPSDAFEPLSHMSWLNGVPVEVCRLT